MKDVNVQYFQSIQISVKQSDVHVSSLRNSGFCNSAINLPLLNKVKMSSVATRNDVAAKVI